DLRARGVRFVQDALREVPGFFVVPGGSYGAATSLFARGGESNYVKVLVDGVAANQPGGGFDFATLSLDNVERIEVVRGPASVVHGSDAVSGVVNVITARGAGPVRGTASLMAGTWGSLKADAAASGGGERLGWSAGGGHFATDGIYAFNSRFETSALSGGIASAPDDRTDLSLSVRHTWNSYAFPTDGGGVPVDSNQHSTGSTFILGATASRRLSQRVELAAALGLMETRYAFADAMDAPADTTGFGFASERRTDVGRLTADVRAHYRPVSWLVVTAGTYAERLGENQSGWASSNFGAGQFTEDQVPLDASRNTWAGYLQASADHPAGLALTAGVRRDDDEAFGGFTTARAGAAYTLASGTRIRSSIGSAFKAPNFSESFADTPFERGDPLLQPERTRSWEAGIEQLLAGGAVSISAAYFDQRFRNLIQYVTTDPPAPTYRNLGAATARGVEANLTVRPIPELSLSGQYTRLATEVTESPDGSLEFLEGGPLLRRPSGMLRLSAGYRVPGRLYLAAAFSAVGAREDIDFNLFQRVELTAYQLLDLSAEFWLPGGGEGAGRAALTLRLENVTDESYDTVLGFPGRGRTLLAGVRARL
ncbi:MAG TPA: TonB-dependent receptor, partial [Gemmatimonadales bacterium]|nr:TonB-dependent receptor [Gemmatimonadales bacterium]